MSAQTPTTSSPSPPAPQEPAPAPVSVGALRRTPPTVTPPTVVRTRAELAAVLARPVDPREQTPAVAAAAAREATAPVAAVRSARGIVMTMGALHRGHAALIRAARQRVDQVVVTIFVNPLQFGPSEDLDRYPRTFDADLALCAREGADIVYAPNVVHDPAPLVTLSAGPLGEVLEGTSRPGHFDGMLTVVGTLLHLVRPEVAFFGRKDAQQLVCIRRMVADLAFPVEVVGVPTVRDEDGLALSSRNAYLDSGQRRSALALSRALTAGAVAAGEGPDAVLSAARAVLAGEPGVALDYLVLANPSDLGPVSAGPALLLVAARVGTTRLIDNIDLVLAGTAVPHASPTAGAVPASVLTHDSHQGV